MAGTDWASFPWTALIWFIGVTVMIFLLEWKGEQLREREPDVFPQRRIALLVYGFVVGVINLVQLMTKVQLIDAFNLIATSLLFIRFWFFEKGPKRNMARNMGILMMVFAVLSLMAAYLDAGLL